MDFDFSILSSQLAPMMNIMKVVKDDNNVTNAKHNETIEKLGETQVYTPRSCSNSSNKTKTTDEQET